MRKAIMIASFTAFAAIAAFAAPRNSDVPGISSTNDEVVILPIDEDITQVVDEKPQGCGCNKPKKAKR